MTDLKGMRILKVVTIEKTIDRRTAEVITETLEMTNGAINAITLERTEAAQIQEEEETIKEGVKNEMKSSIILKVK
jgi:hypothetical protein